MSTKALFRDLAGKPLTILLCLALNARAMKNKEISEWCGGSDKTLATHLERLETKGLIHRSTQGWVLNHGVEQLSFLSGNQTAQQTKVGNSPTLPEVEESIPTPHGEPITTSKILSVASKFPDFGVVVDGLNTKAIHPLTALMWIAHTYDAKGRIVSIGIAQYSNCETIYKSVIHQSCADSRSNHPNFLTGNFNHQSSKGDEL